MGVDYWGVIAGIGLLAVVVAAIAYIRYRERETRTLRAGASLATEMRELARGDAVRLAAVDEYELALYQRLFYVATVSPRIRAAVWALVGAVLAGGGGVATRGSGVYVTVLHGASIFLALVFALATLFYAGLAIFHAATTPRVSFAESYASENENENEVDDDAVASDTSADTDDPDSTATEGTASPKGA